MKTSSIIQLISIIIVLGGILVGAGRFIGSNNTSHKYSKDISFLFFHFILIGSEILIKVTASFNLFLLSL